MRKFKVIKKAAGYESPHGRPVASKLRKLYLKSVSIAGKFDVKGSSSPDSYAENVVESFGKDAAAKTVRTIKTASLKLMKERKQKISSPVKLSEKVTSSRNGKDTPSGRSSAAGYLSGRFKKERHEDTSCTKIRQKASGIKSCKNAAVRYTKEKSLFESRKTEARFSGTDMKNESLSSESLKKAFKVKSVLSSKRKSLPEIIKASASVSRKALLKTFPYIVVFAVFIVLASVFMMAMSSICISPYAVLYSNTNTFDISKKIGQINLDFQTYLSELEKNSDADDKVITGSRAVWQDILCVYAAGYLFNPSYEGMDPSDYLEKVFYDMNHVTYEENPYTKSETVAVTDKTGESAYEIREVEKKRLTIILSHLSIEDMADMYSFTDNQMEILRELQSERYLKMWTDVIYTSGIEQDIVSVALSQVGNTGGEPYWSWYGYTSRVAWCAIFVSWCAYLCGYLDSGACPMFENCAVGINCFCEAGAFEERDYVPSRGDIIFFDWDNDGISDHVGIVVSVEDGTIHTVEGNAGDICTEKTYPLYSELIAGYGILMS